MLSDRTIKEMMKKGDIIITGELDHTQMQPEIGRASCRERVYGTV